LLQFLGPEKRFHTAWTHSGHSGSGLSHIRRTADLSHERVRPAAL
jgi:hypothetical protein